MDIPDFTLPVDAVEAIAQQQDLARHIRLHNDSVRLQSIAGIDVSYDIASDTSFAVIVLMEFDRLEALQTITASMPTSFPYIPGLLSFREIPVILKALAQLKTAPDLLMVDGQGIAHPRRLGIAAHLGVITNIPAVGVAKSRLTGHYHELGPNKGDTSPLNDRGERIGTVLRSKPKTNPLFVSPGHRLDHAAALDITLRCLTRYRLPEPTRIADKISKQKDDLKQRLL
jgi:deoxyribonuclease V